MEGGELFMKFGQEFLNRIVDLLYNEELKYSDTVIIGDNSSGKSLLLKLLIEKYGKSNELYFIDAVNRGFDAGMVIQEETKPEYKQTIINTRIQTEYFNLRDSFNCYGTLTERVEQIYFLFEEKLQTLFEQLTKERFKIIQGDALGEVEFKDGKVFLSSGYQAIVRILLELLYYQEKCIENKGLEKAVVIIDELDEFLSPGYAFKIMPFLKEKFPKMNFIITTHSCDLVAGTQNANLIVLCEGEYEVLDLNDFQSVSEVQIIFERIFGKKMLEENEVDNVLRRLFNNKINNVWSEDEELQLENIQKCHLTASQQIICKQIAEW